MSFIANLFGGGIVQSLEKVAMEALTGKGGAEADALLIKTLDPNGVMRRDIMRFICRVYGFYLVMAVALIFLSAFGLGDVEGVEVAFTSITQVFVPITGLFGALATATFGVNGVNSWKGK